MERPQDLNRRLYNPYAPIRSFTATPRLIWALDEARRNEVTIPPPAPLPPQRTAIALYKKTNKPLAATLWGYDPALTIFGPDSKPFDQFQLNSREYASDIQPFDRVTPGFRVFEHHLSIPADEPPGFYIISPSLELAVLGVEPGLPVLANASLPIGIDSGESFYLRIPRDIAMLRIQSARPDSLSIYDSEGNQFASNSSNGSLVCLIDDTSQDQVLRVQNTARREKIYFRI